MCETNWIIIHAWKSSYFEKLYITELCIVVYNQGGMHDGMCSWMHNLNLEAYVNTLMTKIQTFRWNQKIEFIYCWLTCLICVEKSFFQGEGLSKVEIQHYWYFTERPGALPTYMSHFSYACKTEGENGISHLISALCVNCLSAIPEYSRIIDNSIIWMCIWCGLLQKLHKIKKSEHLNSKVSFKL